MSSNYRVAIELDAAGPLSPPGVVPPFRETYRFMSSKETFSWILRDSSARVILSSRAALNSSILVFDSMLAAISPIVV